MFKIYYKNELMETVMYEDYGDTLKYAKEKYENYIRIEKVIKWLP